MKKSCAIAMLPQRLFCFADASDGRLVIESNPPSPLEFWVLNVCMTVWLVVVAPFCIAAVAAMLAGLWMSVIVLSFIAIPGASITIWMTPGWMQYIRTRRVGVEVEIGDGRLDLTFARHGSEELAKSRHSLHVRSAHVAEWPDQTRPTTGRWVLWLVTADDRRIKLAIARRSLADDERMRECLTRLGNDSAAGGLHR